VGSGEADWSFGKWSFGNWSFGNWSFRTDGPAGADGTRRINDDTVSWSFITITRCGAVCYKALGKVYSVTYIGLIK
jgi:hypothetical protein